MRTNFTNKRFAIIALLLLALAAPAWAVDYFTWTAKQNRQWNDGSNWDESLGASGYPNQTDDWAYFYSSASSDFIVKLGENSYVVGKLIFGQTTYELRNGTIHLHGGLKMIGYQSHTLNIDLVQAATGGWSGLGSVTLNGVLSGSNQITINSDDGGRVAVLNSANTYDGTMIIKNGSVLLGHSLALQSAQVTLNTNGGLQFGGSLTAATIAQLAGTGNLNLGSVDLTITGSNSTQYDGVLSGTGSLIKTGAGSLTLNGASTHSGNTRIDAGKIIIGNVNALQNSTVKINVNNGLDNQGLNAVLGGLAGTSNFNFGSSQITVGGNNTNTTYSGKISGSGELIKEGSGELTLSGTSSYTGGTTINSGSIRVSQDSNLGADASPITIDSGKLTANQGMASDHELIIPKYAVAEINVLSSASDILIWSAPITTDLESVLTKTGPGTMWLTEPTPDLIGTVNIVEGKVMITDNDALKMAWVSLGVNDAIDMSTANSNSSLGIGSLSGSGNLNCGDFAIALGSDNRSKTYSGALSGSDNLIKRGTGTQTLGGDNSAFTGAVIIHDGVMKLTHQNALRGSQIWSIKDNGLDVSANTITDVAGLGSGGDLDIGSTHFRTRGSGSYTYYGDLSGVAGSQFTHDGSGTQTFTGAITGVDRIEAAAAGGGQLVLSDVNATTSELCAGSQLKIQDGAVIDMNTTGIAFSGSFGTLTISGFSTALQNGHELAAATGTGTGSIVIDDFGGVSGFDIITAGRLGTGDIAMSNTAFLTADALGLGGKDSGTFGGVGTMSLSSSSYATISGETRLWTSGSSLTIDTARFKTGTLTNPIGTSPQILISDQLTFPALKVGKSDPVASTTFSGVIADATGVPGSLEKIGTNSFTLSGANTYSGGTIISGGTLLADNASGSATGSGGVQIDGGVLGGTGSVAGSTNVNASGAVAPGASTGVLTVDDIAFNSGSTLLIELAGIGGVAGIDFDQLVVNNTVTINPGATLDISYFGGFNAVAGDSFVILSDATINGEFDTINAPDGQTWIADYDTVGGTLTVGICADDDGDGVCNDNDICPGHDDNADADGDGVPDGCDILNGCNDLADLNNSGDIDLDDYAILSSDWLCTSSCIGDTDGDGDTDLDDLAGIAIDWLCEATP